MPSQELVPKTVADLDVRIARVIDGDRLPEQIVRTALAQLWQGPLKDGGIEAIAHALVLCRDHRLSPLAPKPPVYVMKVDGRWSPMVSAYGYATIAARLTDNAGRPLFRGLDFDDPEMIGEGKEARVQVRCRVYRGPQRDPVSGKASKPIWLKRKDGSVVRDEHAERKAETAAARRAFEIAFPGDMPIEPVPEGGFPDDEAIIIGSAGEVEIGAKARGEHVEVSGTAAPGEVLATKPQLQKLAVLAQSLGWDDDERRERAGVASFKDLSKSRAHELIEEWQEEEADRRAAAEAADRGEGELPL